MQTFLFWRGQAVSEFNLERVQAELHRRITACMANSPQSHALSHPCGQGIYLESPVGGWRPAYYQPEPQGGWALSLDYPVNAHDVLKAAHRPGGIPEGAPPLPEDPAGPLLGLLGARLETDPDSTLESLTPPFALVWTGRADPAALHIQNDGLGFAQLFVYDDGRHWAVSNRLLAFQALGLPLRPVAEEWAVRCALGWFPLELTGFEHVRAMRPGERLTLDRDGLRTQRYDVLARWLRADDLKTPGDCKRAAIGGIFDYLRAAMPLWERAGAGLTGGWDSRVIVAALLHLNASGVNLRVRGRPDLNEVIVARHLADLAGRPLHVETGRVFPPPDAEGLRANIALAMAWQAGHTDFDLAKTCVPPGARFGRGSVSVMGQHGEICRGYYAKRIHASRNPPEQFDALLRDALMEKATPWLRPGMREAARGVIARAIAQADRYGLEGHSRLDFFYLYERTRRWASGGAYAQTSQVIAPFLAPGYIRGTYAWPAERRRIKPFHKHLISKYYPRWDGLPHEDELSPAMRKWWLMRSHARHPGQWAAFWSREAWRATLGARTHAAGAAPLNGYHRREDRRAYDPKAYWAAVGRPLIERGLARDGWWREILDPAAAAEGWLTAPDDLAALMALSEEFA